MNKFIRIQYRQQGIMVGVGWGVTRYQGGGMWVQVGCFIACDTRMYVSIYVGIGKGLVHVERVCSDVCGSVLSGFEACCCCDMFCGFEFWFRRTYRRTDKLVY